MPVEKTNSCLICFCSLFRCFVVSLFSFSLFKLFPQFDNEAEPFKEANNSNFTDPCPGKPKALVFTCYWPKELDVGKLALDSDCFANVPNESFINENSVLTFALTRLPTCGSYQVVYMRGVPEKCQLNPMFQPTATNGGHDCTVYGEHVGISVVGYATDRDEFLEPGSTIGFCGPCGYGPQLFDPEKGYAMVYRSEQPVDMQGFDSMQSHQKTIRQKVVRLDKNGRSSEQAQNNIRGHKNGDEAIFLGANPNRGGDGWTSQSVGGLVESADSSPTAWYFVPSRVSSRGGGWWWLVVVAFWCVSLCPAFSFSNPNHTTSTHFIALVLLKAWQ